MSAPTPDSTPTQYSYPDWLVQTGTIERPKTQDTSIGVSDYSEVIWPTPEEMKNLSTEKLVTMVGIAAAKMSEANLNSDREKLRYYNDLIAGSNEVYKVAANARNEANQSKTSKSASVNDSLIDFSQANGVSIQSGKEYTKEEWDIHMQSIQASQETWIADSKLISVSVEKNLQKAANALQMLTSVVDVMQKLRDKVNDNIRVN